MVTSKTSILTLRFSVQGWYQFYTLIYIEILTFPSFARIRTWNYPSGSVSYQPRYPCLGKTLITWPTALVEHFTLTIGYRHNDKCIELCLHWTFSWFPWGFELNTPVYWSWCEPAHDAVLTTALCSWLACRLSYMFMHYAVNQPILEDSALTTVVDLPVVCSASFEVCVVPPLWFLEPPGAACGWTHSLIRFYGKIIHKIN